MINNNLICPPSLVKGDAHLTLTHEENGGLPTRSGLQAVPHQDEQDPKKRNCKTITKSHHEEKIGKTVANLWALKSSAVSQKNLF